MDVEERFREANERIAEAARSLAFDSRVPFLCECSNPRCTHVVPLEFGEYERARSQPQRLLTLPGHGVSGPASVVEETDRFTFVDPGE